MNILLAYFLFHLLVYLALLIAAALLVHYALTWYSQYQRLPIIANVIRHLDKKQHLLRISQESSESEAEERVAKILQSKFQQVQTQALVGGKAYARERIDIDLAEGKLGIEIKLAEMLRKSNERNRLLGQIDLYLERKYTHQQLLILIIGSQAQAQSANIEEIRRMIENKKVCMHYIKTY